MLISSSPGAGRGCGPSVATYGGAGGPTLRQLRQGYSSPYALATSSNCSLGAAFGTPPPPPATPTRPAIPRSAAPSALVGRPKLDPETLARTAQLHHATLFVHLNQLNPSNQVALTTTNSHARDKLTKLSTQQFAELSTDVYDELSRRKVRRDDQHRTQAPDTLPNQLGLHPKRNQARQKLAHLPPRRFHELATDVLTELQRRYPHLDPSPERSNPEAEAMEQEGDGSGHADLQADVAGDDGIHNEDLGEEEATHKQQEPYSPPSPNGPSSSGSGSSPRLSVRALDPLPPPSVAPPSTSTLAQSNDDAHWSQGTGTAIQLRPTKHLTSASDQPVFPPHEQQPMHPEASSPSEQGEDEDGAEDRGEQLIFSSSPEPVLPPHLQYPSSASSSQPSSPLDHTSFDRSFSASASPSHDYDSHDHNDDKREYDDLHASLGSGLRLSDPESSALARLAHWQLTTSVPSEEPNPSNRSASPGAAELDKTYEWVRPGGAGSFGGEGNGDDLLAATTAAAAVAQCAAERNGLPGQLGCGAESEPLPLRLSHQNSSECWSAIAESPTADGGRRMSLTPSIGSLLPQHEPGTANGQLLGNSEPENSSNPSPKAHTSHDSTDTNRGLEQQQSSTAPTSAEVTPQAPSFPFLSTMDLDGVRDLYHNTTDRAELDESRSAEFVSSYDCETLQTERDRWQAAHDTQFVRADNLQVQLDSLAQRTQQLESQLELGTTLQQERDQWEQAHDVQFARADALSVQLESVQAQLTKVQAQFEHHSTVASSWAADRDALQSAHDAHATRVDTLSAQLEQAEQRHVQSQERLVSRIYELETHHRAQLSTTTQAERDQFHRLADEHHGRAELLQAQLEERSRDAEQSDQASERQAEQSELEQQCHALEQQRLVDQDALSHLRDQIALSVRTFRTGAESATAAVSRSATDAAQDHLLSRPTWTTKAESGWAASARLPSTLDADSKSDGESGKILYEHWIRLQGTLEEVLGAAQGSDPLCLDRACNQVLLAYSLVERDTCTLNQPPSSTRTIVVRRKGRHRILRTSPLQPSSLEGEGSFKLAQNCRAASMAVRKLRTVCQATRTISDLVPASLIAAAATNVVFTTVNLAQLVGIQSKAIRSLPKESSNPGSYMDMDCLDADGGASVGAPSKTSKPQQLRPLCMPRPGTVPTRVPLAPFNSSSIDASYPVSRYVRRKGIPYRMHTAPRLPTTNQSISHPTRTDPEPEVPSAIDLAPLTTQHATPMSLSDPATPAFPYGLGS